MKLRSSRLITVMRKKDGVSSAEYAVLALFIVVAAASAVAVLGDLTKDMYAAATRGLASPPDGVSAAASPPNGVSAAAPPPDGVSAAADRR